MNPNSFMTTADINVSKVRHTPCGHGIGYVKLMLEWVEDD
jgi:hypothetical protein